MFSSTVGLVLYLGVFVGLPLVLAWKVHRQGHELVAVGLVLLALMVVADLAATLTVGSNSNKAFQSVGTSIGPAGVREATDPAAGEPK